MVKNKSAEKAVQENKNLNTVLLILLGIFIVMLSITKLNGEDDLFWHMATGKYITENSVVPSTDVFGHATEGTKWIPFEWGWDVIVYNIFNIAGFAGLTIFNNILLLSIFTLIFLILRKFNIPVPVAVFYLIILVFATRYRTDIKPQVFSLLFLTLLTKLFIDFRYFKSGLKPLYFIPLIFVFWVNLHMGLFAGLLLFGIFLLTSLIDYFRRNKISSNDFHIPDLKELITIIVIFLISLIVLLINPHGIETLTYAYSHTQMKMLKEIYEWYSPFHSNFLGKFYNLLYILFLIGIIPIISFFGKKKDYYPILLSIGFGIYSVQAARFTVDYILVICVFFFLAIPSLTKKLTFFRHTGVITGVILIVLLFLTSTSAIWKFVGFSKSFGTGIYEPTFPVKMYDFIRENKINDIGKKPFQALDYGGFFIWNFPGSKNFIDSRNLNDSHWNNFRTIINKRPGFENLIKQFDFDYFMIFLPLMSAQVQNINDLITSYLSIKSDEWKLVFWDDQSMLFVKNTPAFADVISKFEYKYFNPYIFIFKENVISSAFKNDRETIIKEINRKKSEDPQCSLLLKFLQKYNKEINQ